MIRLALIAMLAGSAAAAEPPEMEAKLADGSRVKLTLLDAGVAIETPHGRLTVPPAAIARLEVAARPDAATRAKIAAAVADLANPELSRRDAAGDDLVRLGPVAYPAVLQASRGPDRDLAINARRLRDRFADEYPETRLPAHEMDVIHTAESKIAGRIAAAELRVRDAKFGERTLRLTDVASIHAAGAAPEEPKLGVQADPGTMTGHAGQVGKTFLFTVTGAAGGSVYGSDVYTSDSSIATACVHAGVLRVGETRTIRVTMMAGQAAYAATTRNGVTSYAWGEYGSSYKVSRTADAPK